jgi:YD repeat-containing protein
MTRAGYLSAAQSISPYDEFNNPLSITQHPKPGSSLDPIEQIYTYDSTWHKVETFTDGEGNETSYDYDPTQGTLLKITRPEIDSQIPEINLYPSGD